MAPGLIPAQGSPSCHIGPGTQPGSPSSARQPGRDRKAGDTSWLLQVCPKEASQGTSLFPSTLSSDTLPSYGAWQQT